MSSMESIKPIMFSYTWQFMEEYTEKTSTISCLAFCVEEARVEILSTLKKIESLEDEKKKAEDEINKLYRIRRTQSKEEAEQTFKQIFELEQALKKKFPKLNDYTGGYGIRVNDYDSDLKVLCYEKNTNNKITIALDALISTIDPKIELAKFVTFT